MKYGKILITVAMAIALPLLMVVMPAKPVLAAPAITLSPTSGAMGTTVTVTGTNFASYVGDSLSIFFNNVEIDNSPVIIPDTGSFNVTFDIPDNATPGVASVTVRGMLGSVLAQTSFVIPTTEIHLDVEEGTVGTAVTIDGQGFYANELVAFYYHYNGFEAKLDVVAASPTGECSYDFLVPASSGGKHKITARDVRGNSAETQFDVIPSATLDPDSGVVGDIVTVTGTGFGYGSEITIYFRSAMAGHAYADRHGNFQGAFKVPSMEPRSYDVKIRDEHGNTVWLEFTITADAALSETIGNVGMELIISGTGFIPGKTISIKYDAAELTTTTADDSGAFSATFNVPASTGGTHLVTASDGTNSVQLSFTMESEAPPVPALLLPETGVPTKSPVRLLWQDIDDPSPPVTYNLQIASDKNFTSIVLEKKGLTDSEYTPTGEEKLEPTKEEAPYYWRVKAIDAASNESDWSAPATFYLIRSWPLPLWVIYILIGVGVLAITFIVWGLRRRPYSKYG